MRKTMIVDEIKNPRWGSESNTEIKEYILRDTENNKRYCWYMYTDKTHPEYTARELNHFLKSGDLIAGVVIINDCISYTASSHLTFTSKSNNEQLVFGFEPTVNQFDLIRTWARERGIYEKGDSKTQLIKLYEEAGELSRAVLKSDTKEIVDGIGDCVVVLTNLAVLCGFDIEFCINAAYNEIKDRKGGMQNGTFQKEI